MTRNILINRADFKQVKNNIRNFLITDPQSPFYNKNYNFESSALSGLLDMGAYLIHYLSYTLNKNIEEIFLDTATLENSVYSLIKNYNYIPQLKRPATSFLKMKYFRNTTVGLVCDTIAGYSVAGTVTQGGVSGTIQAIDTMNKVLYMTDVAGGSFSIGAISGAGTVSSVDTDYNSDDDDKNFTVYWNSIKYTDDYNIIPSFRDSVQESYYDGASVTDYENENIISYSISPYIDTDGTRYLQLIMNVFQGTWTSMEFEPVGVSFSADPNILLQDQTASISYDDKVIVDSIRVFVQEGGSGDWIEYHNINTGIVNQNQTTFDGGRMYAVKYVPDIGVYLTFNIDNITRSISSSDNIRIYFAITEGDDINEVSGNNEYTYDDFETIIINDETDITSPVVIFDSTNYGTVGVGNSDYLESELLLENNNNSERGELTNGGARQTTESIKQTASKYYTTQGRLITEDDYNIALKSKFSEFVFSNTWGGQREFLDIETLMEDEIGGSAYSVLPTAAEMCTTLKNVMRNMYVDGLLSINTVSSDDLTVGKYIRDLGHIYFTMIGTNNEFIDDASTINEVKAFFDERKIMTIMTKYFSPTIVLMKPELTLRIKQAFKKEVDINEIKQNIYSDFLEKVKFNNIFYFSELEKIILDNEEVDSIITKNYKYDLKIKNGSTKDDYIYIRTYTQISGNLNNIIRTKSGTEFTLTTNNANRVYINGGDVGEINKSKGFIRIQNNNAGSMFFTDDWFYVLNVNNFGSSYRFNAIKDCFLTIQSPSSISISVV